MPMQELVDFVTRYTKMVSPEDEAPTDRCADVVFFKVLLQWQPDPEILRRLILENPNGAFCEMNLLEGSEYSYIQVGGWIGDQGLALRLIGMGKLLGLWDLMTPKMILGPESNDLIQQMAGLGYISIINSPKA